VPRCDGPAVVVETAALLVEQTSPLARRARLVALWAERFRSRRAPPPAALPWSAPHPAANRSTC
jgi:hypothetical protein